MPDLTMASAKKRHAEEDSQKSDALPRKSKKKRSSLSSRDGWTISRGVGGNLLHIDPVFSDDGETIAIAFPNSVRVFSTRTSLLLRSLDVGKGKITGLARSPRNSSEVLVSTDQGRLNKWNWSEDLRANMYDLGRKIRGLESVGDFPDDTADVLCTIEDAEGSGKNTSGGSAKYVNCITLHALNLQGLDNRRRTIYRSKVPLDHLRVLQGGECIIASAGSQLVIGTLRDAKVSSDLDQLTYAWHQLDTPGQVTCLDVYLRRPAKSKSDVDVAIGTLSGPIHLYSNLLAELRKVVKRKGQANPSVQKLHWHRYAVGAVKFSKDGNYLISGGIETVLCSWQLDTGRRQDLPHLTASIESLVVSPDGASYAVALGNNSIIILSTLDFQPTFAFTGPAWPVDDDEANLSIDYPAITRPNSIPAQILLATPSSTQSGSDNSSPSAVYLQTIDVRTGLQLGKQAMTRNNATDRMTSPQGYLIAEPNVTLMAISRDGNWLVTVEKWEPPAHDQQLVTDSHGTSSSILSRPETFLKFWNFDSVANRWELTSRVDEPHAENSYDAFEVLDLQNVPSGFMTVGTDGRVRTWQQHYRQRNQLQVKDKDGRRLTSWFCASSLPVPPSPIVNDLASPISSAKLAASEDGSLAGLVLQYRHATTVCLIDTLEQTIVSARNDLALDYLYDLAITDRYLIILSSHLLVWDIIHDAMHFSYTFQNASLVPSPHLATHPSGSFAVAIRQKSGNSSRIAVFDPQSSDPLTVHQLGEPVRGLFPSGSSQGFVIITSRSHIYHLAPPNALLNNIKEEKLPKDNQKSRSLLGKDLPIRRLPGLGMDLNGTGSDGRSGVAMPREENVITQSKLAELFDSSGSAAKIDAGIMFERVAELTIGRSE